MAQPPQQLTTDIIEFLRGTLNSVGATKNLAAQIATLSKGTQAERPLQLTGQSLSSHQDQINLLLKYIRAIRRIIQTSSAVKPIISSATFVFGGNDTDLVAGDITGPLPVGPTGGTCFLWTAQMNVAPTGQSARFDIQKWVAGVGTSIFGANPLPNVPAGSLDINSGTLFDGTVTLAATTPTAIGDSLNGVIDRAGSAIAGQRAKVELFWM